MKQLKPVLVCIALLASSLQALATGGVLCQIKDKKVKAEISGETARFTGAPLVGGLSGSVQWLDGKKTAQVSFEAKDSIVTQYYNYNNELRILLHVEEGVQSQLKQPILSATLSLAAKGRVSETAQGLVQRARYTLTIFDGNNWKEIKGRARCIHE